MKFKENIDFEEAEHPETTKERSQNSILIHKSMTAF